MFGKQQDGSEKPAAMELLRLAVPRRVYTKEHIDYAVDVARRVAAKASCIQGMRIIKEPSALWHFTAQFEPIP